MVMKVRMVDQVVWIKIWRSTIMSFVWGLMIIGDMQYQAGEFENLIREKTKI